MYRALWRALRFQQCNSNSSVLLTLILIPYIRAEMLHWIRIDCSVFTLYPKFLLSVALSRFWDWLRAQAVFEVAKYFRLGLSWPLDG